MDTIKIQIDTNAAQASKSFEDLSKSFKNTDAQAEDLRKQIRGLKDELYKLTPGTEEYGQVLQELGGKMDQLQNTTIELRAATGGLDTVFQTTTSATASLASGFTAASGVISLFGGDAEELQQTFVKLQAMMAIMNGLKGFAGFVKTTKAASTSLKAFIAQSTLARKATQQQAAATTTLSTTEVVATGATTGLAAGFRSLTAAIASNPIGLLLVALAGAVTLISKVAGKAKEAAEAQEEYNQAVGNTPPPVKSADEQLKEYLDTLDRYDTKLKTLGVSEERRKEIKVQSLEEEIKAGEKELAVEKKIVEEREKELSQMDVFVALGAKWGGYLSGHQKRVVEITNALKSLREELQKIKDTDIPESMQTLNATLGDLSNEFKVKIAGGLATQGDYLKAQIDVYQKAYNDLWEIVGGGGAHASRKIKGSGTEEGQLNKELATRYQAQIKALQVELDVYNAGLQKKARDAAKSAADAINKNYKKLTDDITAKAIEYKDAWRKILEQFQNLGALTAGDDLSLNESMGRAFTEMNRYSMQLDEYLKEWLKTADKALRAGEITQAKYDQFKKFLESVEKDLGTSLLADMNETLSEAVLNAGSDIQSIAEKFKKDNEAMLAALSGGLVSKEEYHSFLESRIRDYQTEIGPAVEQAMKLIDEEVAKAAPEDQGRLREIMTAYINSADDIIPSSVMNQITSSLKEMIDKQFNEIENGYEARMNLFESYWEDKTRSWLEGGNTSVWGNSTLQQFKDMQQQADDLYKLMHSQYTEEAALLEEKMSLLDKDSEAYRKYNEELQRLRDADAKAQEEHDRRTVSNRRKALAEIIEDTQAVTESLSGLSSAMGSYYAEQAEQAKATYGEQSEEYKKYLKKEGNMKIAQVWTDFATGVMRTWAGYAEFGPLTYVLAGIQTAALLATAIASTQQIKRQTNASASGGESTANVGQLTDRIIMADAQNTDQTAQLNAEYSAGNQRVYVTQSDISDAQDTNRVAVTNNRF